MILRKKQPKSQLEERLKKKENIKALNQAKKIEKENSKKLRNKLKGQNEISDRERKVDKNFLKSLKVPATVQNTIRYNRMFEDGVCDVEGGIYSKTIKFSDINYQIAKRDDQIDIFSRYCEFLNYFDPSINVQITINNRRIDQEDFKKRILLYTPKKDDGLNKYRYEYNQMLIDKALKGQNGIIREKYLTFSCEASNYEQGVQVLSRIEADVQANMKRLGCINSVLSGSERCEFIHSIFNPDEPYKFEYEYLLENSLSTKDFIAPDSFDFKDKRSFEFGNRYGQVVYLKDLPSDLSDKLLSELSDLNCYLTINLHINRVSQDKALDLVKSKIAFMEQQKIDEQKKAIKAGYDPEMIPHELKFSLLEANELLDDLLNKNQGMFKNTILIFTSGKTKEELEENIYQISSICRKNNCKIGYLDYLQEEGINSTLILGKNYVDIKRTLTTASTGIFVPFTTQELFHNNGTYYGCNSLSKNLILVNRKNLKTANGFILGSSGSGKSLAAKREIANVLLSTNDDVIVIDPEREYTPLAKGIDNDVKTNGFYGEVIKISAGSNNFINPFDINLDYADDDNPISLKSEFILSLCEILIGGRYGLSSAHKTIIDRTVLLTYEKYFNNPKKEDVPTLKTFYSNLVEQPEPEANDLALALEIYINGSLSVFSHHTNIDINNRFVVFDTKDLGKQLNTIGMLVVLDQIWNRITQNRKIGRRTWIYIDEIYLLFKNEYSDNYLFELWKRARKWGAIPTGITQNVEDLLRSDNARSMLSNSEFIYMLNQASSDRDELAHLLNISDQQLNYVTNSDPGHGLIFAGNAIIPFEDDFPKKTELYKMLTTKIEEVTAGV